jgi:CMP/dCMP kinase
MNTEKRLTIAVDGYSSCGKSTFAKAIASKLGYVFIDSGAMYRAATLFFMRAGLAENGNTNKDKIIMKLSEVNVGFRNNALKGHNDIYLNGENVEREIREAPVSGNVSAVSKIPEVREKMVLLQRSIGKDGGIVMDGRDIGTVVFPEADIKIFMTASPEIRANRRYLELIEKNMEADLGAVLKNITERDRIDETRAVSPLRKADDAIILDNSYLTPEEQMEWFMRLYAERTNES